MFQVFRFHTSWFILGLDLSFLSFKSGLFCLMFYDFD